MYNNSNQYHKINYIFMHNYEPDMANPEEYNIKLKCQRQKKTYHKDR